MKQYAWILLVFILMFSIYGCMNRRGNSTKVSDSSKNIAVNQNDPKQLAESQNGGSDKDSSSSEQPVALKVSQNNSGNFK